MGKVTGLGGTFLKAKDPATLYAWYEKHLGIGRDEHGAFSFSEDTATSHPMLVFFPQDSDYFGGGEQKVMMNFRVSDLDGLLDALTAAGVSVDTKRESYDFGKFGWFTDLEGNRVELWEPAGS